MSHYNNQPQFHNNHGFKFVSSSRWTCNFSYKWSQTLIVQKVIFSVSIFILVLQITSIAYVLFDTWNLTCQEPFRLFLFIHAIRSIILTPFNIYLHFGYTRLSEYDDLDDVNLIMLERTRILLKRVQSIFNIFSIVWFLFGNYLLFYNSDIISCDLTANAIYNVSYMTIIYGYVLVLLPILYSIFTFICLPCILYLLKLLHIITIDDTTKPGVSSMDISSLPLYQFHPSNPSNKPVLLIPNTQDQFCVICLSQYDDDQVICKLWCEHHFHEKCLFDWLKLNAKCPLCKRDRRKNTEKIQLLPL